MSFTDAPDAEVTLARPRRDGDVAAAASDPAPRRFHTTMPGYAPTPLRDAPHTARLLGVGQVLVKDESSRLGLPSFKVLGASWAVYRALLRRLDETMQALPTLAALQQAALRLRPLTLAAATDGNHGRAVARMAALLGFSARIYVPTGTAQAVIDAIHSEGAVVAVVDGGYGDAVRQSAADADERCLVVSDTSWPGYEDIPGWVIDGYATMFLEIEDALARDHRPRPTVVVVPLGVGALAAAAIRHFWAAPARPRMVGVEPTSAACIAESIARGAITTLQHPQHSIMAGLNCATPSLVAWPNVSHGIDVYLTVADRRVPGAMRLLAQDGIAAGPTGASGLAGMLRVAEEPASEARAVLDVDESTRILLLCTEGVIDPTAYRRLLADEA